MMNDFDWEWQLFLGFKLPIMPKNLKNGWMIESFLIGKESKGGFEIAKGMLLELYPDAIDIFPRCARRNITTKSLDISSRVIYKGSIGW